MNLHLDKDAFRVLIGQVSEKTVYRQDVIEKDYYVTMILQELVAFQKDGLPAYFKGGTALYKALHSVRRFSEKSKSLYFSENPNQNKIQTYA